MNQTNYVAEPPPEYINFLEETETDVNGYNLFNDELFGQNAPPFSFCTKKKTACLPRSMREHLIIEYTAIFVNVEGDVAEFYIKMSNELLNQFPFLHVDHPLHEYYEFIKQHPEKRVLNNLPHLIPKPLKNLFDHVTEIEKKKQWKSETTEKVLKEKQKLNLLKKRKKTEEQQDQSYLALFQKYMESDEESEIEEKTEKKDKKDKNDKNEKEKGKENRKENRKEKETETKQEKEKENTLNENVLQDMNNFIQKIKNLNNNSVNSYLHLLIKHIENCKFLQFGTAEYNYFKHNIVNEVSPSIKECLDEYTDLLAFLLKLSEGKGINLEKNSESSKQLPKEEKTEENEDTLKTMQNFRREKAKMLLHGLQKK